MFFVLSFVLYLPQESYYSQCVKVMVCHTAVNTEILKEKK